MVMKCCYTDKERREILSGAAEYDKLSAAQQLNVEKNRANAVKQATSSMRWAVELYELLEQENIGYISEAHREIGTLRAVKERFADNDHIQQWCDYFIRCALCEIEELTEEVKYARETARELGRL